MLYVALSDITRREFWNAETRHSGRIVGNSSRKPLPQSLNERFAQDSARNSRLMPSEDGQILRNLRESPDDRSRLSQDCTEPGGWKSAPTQDCRLFRSEGRRSASLASQAGGTAGGVCVGGARDFPTDSWRLGKDGTYAYSPGDGERRCTDGCTPNGAETAN